MLVISPRPELQRRLAPHIESQRIALEPVASVEEALKHRARPDVVFFDLSGMSTEVLTEAMARLRAAEFAPHAVATICAREDLTVRVAAARAGVDLFLVEPLGHEALREATQTLLEHSSSAESRVLVIDDDVDFVELAQAMLVSGGYWALGVTDSDLSVDSLRKSRPDVVVVDFEMPRFHGLELTRMLRSSREFVNTPVIFLSAHDDPDSIREAFAVGADDFLVKPIDFFDLIRRVEGRLERSRQLRLAAERDVLTGLMTRPAFIAAVDNRLASSMRNRTGLSFCLIDLDQFKRLNDVYGHMSGDDVLAALGDLLQSGLRAEDLKCRWGGEEFALVLPSEHSHAAAHALISGILDKWMQMRFRSESGELFSASFSAGIAHYEPGLFHDDATTDSDRLVQIADRRLYLAKGRGRETVVSDDEQE